MGCSVRTAPTLALRLGPEGCIAIGHRVQAIFIDKASVQESWEGVRFVSQLLAWWRKRRKAWWEAVKTFLEPYQECVQKALVVGHPLSPTDSGQRQSLSEKQVVPKDRHCPTPRSFVILFHSPPLSSR